MYLIYELASSLSLSPLLSSRTKTKTKTTIITKTVCKCANCLKLTINKVSSVCKGKTSCGCGEWGVWRKKILQLVKATDRQIKWKLKELISLWLGSKCAFWSFLWRLCAVGGLMSFHHLTFHIVYFTVLCCSFVAIYSFSLFRSVLFFFASAIVLAIHGNVSFSRKLFWWDWKTLSRWLSPRSFLFLEHE